MRDGVLIGTRPSINLAVAQLAAPSVVRIGQDHMNLATYRDGLRAQLRAVYPRLDLVSTLTEGDAAAYRKLLRGTTRVECMPNGVPDTAGLRARAGREGRRRRRAGHAAEGVRPAAAGVGEGRRATHPDWELRIFGDGRLAPKLRKQIDGSGSATAPA